MGAEVIDTMKYDTEYETYTQSGITEVSAYVRKWPPSWKARGVPPDGGKHEYEKDRENILVVQGRRTEVGKLLQESRFGASRRAGVDNCQRKLARGRQGGGPSTESHSARLSTLGAQGQWFGLPISGKDQEAARLIRAWNSTSTNRRTSFPTSVASLESGIFWGGVRQS